MLGDRFRWVFDSNLVKTTLDDILGVGGWRTEARPGRQGGTRQWIIATGHARERADSVPEPPEDWLPDHPFERDEPPDDMLF